LSHKIHFLDSHFDFFAPNLGAVTDEQVERFHQDISIIEQRYQSRLDESMINDYFWYLKRDDLCVHEGRNSSGSNEISIEVLRIYVKYLFSY